MDIFFNTTLVGNSNKTCNSSYYCLFKHDELKKFQFLKNKKKINMLMNIFILYFILEKSIKYN